MTLREQIMKLQTYKMYEGEDTVYVERDDVLKALEQQPSEDCISRAYVEPIVEELENICINGDEHILSLLSNIKNAPPVTPQRLKGKWIEDIQRDDYDDSEIIVYKCSQCGDSNLYESPFCPNCGAEMRGDADETN